MYFQGFYLDFKNTVLSPPPMLLLCIDPHQILKGFPTCSQHLWETLYMLKLSVALYFWQFLGCPKTFIRTGVSSIEFFCYIVLDFLSLTLPCTYSLSLECSRYNTSSTINSTISELLKNVVICLVLSGASCSFKI